MSQTQHGFVACVWHEEEYDACPQTALFVKLFAKQARNWFI